MGICVISQQDTFSVREAGVREVWEDSLAELRNRKRTRMTKCIECRIQSLCGMCPANGEMENGDKESPVEFLCHVAHLRAAAIGTEVPAHGDCEFCAGGSEHEALLESARRINSKEIDVESWVGPAADFADSEQFQRGDRGVRELWRSLMGLRQAEAEWITI